MKKNDFWIYSLIVFTILAKTTHNKLFAIVGILNALLVLYHVAARLWEVYHERD